MAGKFCRIVLLKANVAVEFFCQIEKSCNVRGSQIKYFVAIAKEANSSISSQRKTIDAKAADDVAAAATVTALRGSK